MPVPVVSIVLPVYNEAATLAAVVSRVQAVAGQTLRYELVVVDDGSTDTSRQLILELAARGIVKACYHPRNLGKGAALRSGFSVATGEFIVVQDADAEYDPNEHQRLLKPLMDNVADVVYGNRMHRSNPVGYRRYWLGNYVISLWCSLLYGRRVHDVETGAKAFRRALLPKLHLAADRFDFEVEFTVQVLRSGARYMEVPVSYRPRKFTEGKKITWRDGVQALWLLFTYRFFGGMYRKWKMQIPK